MNVQEIINDRLTWKGNNFILCIPLKVNYQQIKTNFSNQYPDQELFDEKTLHVSFGRFRLNTHNELNLAIETLQKCFQEDLEETLKYSINKFGKFSNYFSLFPNPKLNLINNKIQEIFMDCPKYKHDGRPHITIACLNKTSIKYVEKIKFEEIKVNIKDLRIIAQGPIENEDGEDEYLELK